jgi:hypothetical protein
MRRRVDTFRHLDRQTDRGVLSDKIKQTSSSGSAGRLPRTEFV